MARGSAALVRIARRLADDVDALGFAPPVTHVYNPLRYAFDLHREYLERWGAGPKEVVLLGMNPGPFGMAQSGVPFGDVTMVRTFLGLGRGAGPGTFPGGATRGRRGESGGVDPPAREHPARPILGLACPRSEVSGTRLWGWARDRFGTPERFFARFFVANYCPLAFMESSGRNRTPDKLPPAERRPLFEACDQALGALVTALAPRLVVGVGAFATARARTALGPDVAVATILHPSPASPAANRGWAEAVDRQLRASGVAI